MSGDSSQRVPGGPFRTADDIVRAILDDHHATTTNISPSGELYRAIERYHNLDLDAPNNPNMPSDPSRDLQRRFSREPRSRNSPGLPSLSSTLSSTLSSNLDPNPPPSLPPLRLLHRRPSGMSNSGATFGGPPPPIRPGRYRSYDRYPRGAASMDPTNFDDMANSHLESALDDANSHLRALLDFSHNDSLSMPPSPPLMSPSGNDAEESRRVKRRKLDLDRPASSFENLRYGRFGQVEPGQLNMEIVSCDGGLYSEGASYAAENILKNDSSVYCTKGNRCNIVLRHQGGIVFNLKELVIKAPGRNYSAPVREGMVFIAMTQDDLLMRTAQYQIQYVPSRFVTREGRPALPVLSIQHNEDGSTVTRAQLRARRLYSMHSHVTDDDDECARAQIPSEFTVAPPPFRVTTECSDEEGEELHNPRFRRRTPNRIGALPFESDSSDDWVAHVEDTSLDELSRYVQGRSDRAMALNEAAEASQLATQEAVRAVGGELMAPHAKFYIEKNKNKCTVRFDPPVSGRFMLLKMWNPHHDPTGNIDIQGVIARGFAGPRYFPSVDLR